MTDVHNPNAYTPWSLGYATIRPGYVRTHVAIGHAYEGYTILHLPVTLDGVIA